MSKFARGRSWIEQRLADRLLFGGTEYTVDLVARRGTGVQGFRVSVVYMPREEASEVEASLPNAATIADVHRLARELQADPDRLRELYDAART